MMALFLQKSANTPNSLAKVQQKMHIRKQSEKFYKKIIDSNLFIRYSSLIQARLKMR